MQLFSVGAPAVMQLQQGFGDQGCIEQLKFHFPLTPS